jgi:hypothetical protein
MLLSLNAPGAKSSSSSWIRQFYCLCPATNAQHFDGFNISDVRKDVEILL